jgi:integrase
MTRRDVRSVLLELRSQAVSIQGQKRESEREGKRGLSRSTVRQFGAILSAIFEGAIRDELREDNPARGVFRQPRTKAAKARSRPRVGQLVKAMTREERDRFLACARDTQPEWYTAFALAAFAGLRRNEALGLRWESVDLRGRRIRIHEQLGSGSTKSGEERTVDLGAGLAAHLRQLRVRLKEEAFRAACEFDERERVVRTDLPDAPTRRDIERVQRRVLKATRRVIRRADLPRHFTMHSLRHTFCSLLISAGVSPVYVQQQAGHGDVGFTVRVYGSWFAMSAPGAMDALSDGAPGLPVAKAARNGSRPEEASAETLEPTGTTPRPGGRGPRTP